MTETKKDLSVEEVRALIVRAIEEKGADYVYHPPVSVDEYGDEYKDCVYVDQERGQPSCLVGHVLVAAGVPQSSILPYEGTSADATWGSLIEGQYVAYLRDEASVTSQALWAAQQAQDNGKTWGEALEAFDKTVKELTEEQA